MSARDARLSFAEAEGLGAEKLAPYEFYGAKVRMEEARQQAAHAEYGNAKELMDEADELARLAIAKSQQARKEAAEEAKKAASAASSEEADSSQGATP